jgi:hypothetical protein
MSEIPWWGLEPRSMLLRQDRVKIWTKVTSCPAKLTCKQCGLGTGEIWTAKSWFA